MAGILYPKDYALVNLLLVNSVQNMDLKNIMVELSYHEDIFNNTTSGYVMVADSMGYIELLSMNGTEFLKMTFAKINGESEVDKTFRVYKVDKRKLENNMYTESYCLYFCSEEMLLSEQYKICKSYPQSTISDNVYDILSYELGIPDDKMEIDETYGVYDFVVPTLKPFDAVNWMSNYARPSAGVPGADMVFFENKHGFNFKSLQKLMTQPPYYNYSYNPKNTDEKNMHSNVYNVTTYEILNSFDTLHGVNSGIFANHLLSIDVLTRRLKTTEFDYMSYEKKSKSLNRSPIINNYSNIYGDKLTDTSRAVYKLAFSNFNQKIVEYIENEGRDPEDEEVEGGVVESPAVGSDIFAETFIPYRTAQLSLTNYIRIKISVPGDPALTVGQTLNFSLLSLTPESKTADAYYSGKYLITAVRHMITMNEYKTVLELAKDSVPTKYASASGSLE